jgi:protein phosphatase 2C
MEEISSSVAVPFTLGNLIQKDAAVTTHMEITGLKLMANTAAALILNPAVGNENHADVSLQHQITVSAEVKENQVGASVVSEMLIECGSNWILSESHNQAIKDDEIMLAVDFQCLHNSGSQSVADSPIIVTVGDEIHGKFSINEVLPALKAEQNTVSVAMDIESENRSVSEEADPKLSAILLDQLPKENKTLRTSNQNGLELSSGPLWGFSSICGNRPEMEDAVAVKPQLFQVPSQMLMDDHLNENTKYPQAHFFGVYYGHGGFQVCALIKSYNLYY